MSITLGIALVILLTTLVVAVEMFIGHRSIRSLYDITPDTDQIQHYALLERNLIYTGVTRGKKLVITIDQTKALVMVVKNKKAARRLTRLAFRIA